MTTTTAYRLASDKQVAFIKKLTAEKDTSAIEDRLESARALAVAGTFGTAAASLLIDTLLRQPRKATTTDAKPVPQGMHKLGDSIFKVQIAVHGSGNLYAKELVQAGPDAIEDGFRFEYAPGAIRKLSEATLMTLADAKAFGALYGTCCVCGRTLTNEESIEAGIGPVCAGRFAN